MIAAGSAAGVERYLIYVEYEWLGSPVPDYTLKVYSKSNTGITDGSYQSHQIHMDGQQPSGFTGTSYRGMGGWDCNPGGTTPAPQPPAERDVADIPVKSLLDVFEQS